MKICRFDDDRLGLVEGGQVADVTEALGAIPSSRWPAPHGDALIANLDAVRAGIERVSGTASRVPVTQVRLLSPVANPTKIIGAPVNYKAHLEEARADPGVSFGQDI